MSLRFKNFVALWIPPLLWAFVIFIFSSFPTGQALTIDWQDFIVKKTAHIIEYFIFSTLLYRALKGSSIEKSYAGIFAIAISVIYGASDEFHQSFTPGREPRIRDVIFDTIGATIAIYIIWKYLPKTPKRLIKLVESLRLL